MLKLTSFFKGGYALSGLFLNVTALATPITLKDPDLRRLQNTLIEFVDSHEFGNCGHVDALEASSADVKSIVTQNLREIYSGDIELEDVELGDKAVLAFLGLDEEHIDSARGQQRAIIDQAKAISHSEFDFVRGYSSGEFGYSVGIFVAIDLNNDQIVVASHGLCE